MPAPPVVQALQNPTAFRLQSGWEVAKLIGGNFAPNNGWANAGAADANAAVLETVVDTPIFGGGTTVVFDLHQTYNNDHGVGCFILSVTDADRSLFADGLASNGQLGDPSIWTPITVTSATATDGTVLNQFTSPDRIVAVDQNSSESIYTVVGETSVEGITGVRVDMCRDLVNISTGGPGLASNRNYVLTEFVFSAGAL